MFTTSRSGLQKTGSSYNFVPNQHFQKISNHIRVFDYCQSNGSIYDLKNWFTENLKQLRRINILEKIQMLYVFSTIYSQMEELATSKNGFKKTGSSYNFVQNQHFRNMSNPIRVFDYCHSNGSIYDLQKWFSENLKQLKRRRETTFSKISNTMHVFDYFQSNGSVYDLQEWLPENRKQL